MHASIDQPSPDRNGAVPASISEAKLAANRANAQLSTGPRTEEGKAVSSRNNTRHGLAGDFCLLPGEDAAQFQVLLEALTAEHNPKTTTETLLVWDMARHHWLTQRAIRLQDECIALFVDEKKLGVLLRYQTTHQRAFHKCLADLLKVQKERKKEEHGFEPKNAIARSRSISQTPDRTRERSDSPSTQPSQSGFVPQSLRTATQETES